MFTSDAALIRVAPVALSISPLTATEPALEAIVSEPALTAPLEMSPRAFNATAPVPATRAAPGATFIAPVVAVSPMAPLLVTIDWLTFTSRLAVIFTAPLGTPPRPSTWALTLMSLPADTSSPDPPSRFTIGWLMSTLPAALMLTGPVWPSMNESIATDPADDAMDSAPLVMSGPVCTVPAVLTVMGAAPAKTALPAATLTVPCDAVRLIAPLLVTTKSLMLMLLPAVMASAPPEVRSPPVIAAFTLISTSAWRFVLVPVRRTRVMTPASVASMSRKAGSSSSDPA